MLITELKSKESILSLVTGKVFIINCHGCKEVRFPETEAEELEKELLASGKVTGVLTTDYICNPENLKLRLERRKTMIAEADAVLVLSCGVGVQSVAEFLPDKKVYAGCDTYRLPGFQGVTPLEVNAVPKTANAKSIRTWNAAGSAFTSVLRPWAVWTR